MKYQCIEMNYNNNCIFGDAKENKECDKVDVPRVGRDKPCEICEVTVYWWKLKMEEFKEREQRRKASARY